MYMRLSTSSFSSFTGTKRNFYSSTSSIRKTLTFALLLSSSTLPSYTYPYTIPRTSNLLIQAVEISTSSSCSASSGSLSTSCGARNNFPRPTALVAARVELDGSSVFFSSDSNNQNPNQNQQDGGFHVRDLLAFKGINKSKPLSPNDFKDKVVLIVNTASLCGYTPQLSSLQSIYEKYSSQGLIVLGLPCNDFGEQEPWSEDKVLQFYQEKHNVQFPLSSKVRILGGEPHPLYNYIMRTLGDAAVPPWNFHKILLSRKGDIVGLFPPDMSPTATEITTAIEQELKVNQKENDVIMM